MFEKIIEKISEYKSQYKKYFYKLNISPNIEIISDNTRDYYLTRAMRKTIKEFEKNVDEVNLMIDLFGGNRRNLDSVEEMILSNYYNVVNLKDYEAFLNNAEQEYVDSIKSEKVVNDYICKRTELLKQKIIYGFLAFDKDVQNILNDFVGELNKFNRYTSFVTNLNQLYSLDIPKFSTKQINDNLGLKEVNKEIKDFISFREMFEKNSKELFKNTKPVFGMLHLKGDNREDIFERFKKELQIYIDCGIDCVYHCCSCVYGNGPD